MAKKQTTNTNCMAQFFSYGQYGKDKMMLAVHKRNEGGGSTCIWKTTLKWEEGTHYDVMVERLKEKANKAGYFEF